MQFKHLFLALSLMLAACASLTRAQTVLWRDSFSDAALKGWVHTHYGGIRVLNQQFNVYGSNGPMNPDWMVDTSVNGTYVLPSVRALVDGQTLELRVDLIQINKEGAWAGIDFVWIRDPDIYGYAMLMDEKNIALGKFNVANVMGGGAWFFHQHPALKNGQVTLILALTRVGSDLRINTRVLDKEYADAILFDHTVTDTSAVDPTLPNRELVGALAGPDQRGTPWPLVRGPTGVALLFFWMDSINGTKGDVEVTFDNVEVRLYEPPALKIHLTEAGLIVSWPVVPGNWVLESSGRLEGPYSKASLSPSIVDSRLEVAVQISDEVRFFRLRL